MRGGGGAGYSSLSVEDCTCTYICWSLLIGDIVFCHVVQVHLLNVDIHKITEIHAIKKK